MAGNKTIVEYKVNWIDKIPPQIKGVENNKTYNKTMKINYSDNLSGIKQIKKEYFGDLKIGITNFEENENYYQFRTVILRVPSKVSSYKICKVINENKQIDAKTSVNYKIPKKEKFEIYAEITDVNGKVYISEKINANNLENFKNEYLKYNLKEDNNTLSNPGNYEITVIDKANNISNYKVKIEK